MSNFLEPGPARSHAEASASVLGSANIPDPIVGGDCLVTVAILGEQHYAWFADEYVCDCEVVTPERAARLLDKRRMQTRRN